jgi:GDP-L-fucose synthase
MNMFRNQKILVTGGGGMIGRSLVKLLLERGAKVRVADIYKPSNLSANVEFVEADLRFFDQCIKICEGMDYVFSLVGIKASPKMTTEKPASFMVPMLQFNTNMMEAATKAGVKWYLYTSSVGVYAPADVFKEDTVWSTFPSPNDRFAGWAKRMGELQAEAYGIEYGLDNISIVRPANVFGEYDNFDPNNAMVIPSLIRKAHNAVDTVEVWGDGSPIRDFIYAEDVARGMIFAVENRITEPLNLGSGVGYSIKEMAETVVKIINERKIIPVKINWLTDKGAGDKIRVFDMTRANSYGFSHQTSLEDGLRKTINWFYENLENLDKRYNAFTNG